MWLEEVEQVTVFKGNGEEPSALRVKRRSSAPEASDGVQSHGEHQVCMSLSDLV